MNVTETSAEGLKREYKIVVETQDIENRIVDRLAELGRTVRIPGFRPGKVPTDLLRKRFGGTVRGEVLEQALQQTSAQALAEKGVRPALQPRIEAISFEDGDDLEYTLAVEMLPEIEPGDFRELKLTRETAQVGEDEIDQAIERLAAREKNFVAVTDGRPAVSGDALMIDFVGSVDGAPFEGGAGSDHVIELGSSSFIATFEDQLIGAKAGDHVTVNVTFPDDYPKEGLAGKEAVFEVDVKEVQAVEEVAVDEAFAQSHGFENLGAMRDIVKEQIARDYGGLSRAKLKRALLDALSDSYDFAVPEGMIDAEFDAIWQRITEDRENDRLDPADAARDEDELREEYRAISERRVRLGLLLSEVGQRNGISVGQDDLNRAIAMRARTMPGQEEMVMKFYRENPEAMNELQAPLFEEKVVDFILEMAEVTDKTVALEELVRDPDAAAPETAAKPKKKAAKKTAAKKAPGKKSAAKKTAKKSAKKPD